MPLQRKSSCAPSSIPHMDWIIKKSKQIRFHTDLSAVTEPFKHWIQNYNWLISDLDFITDKLQDLPINFDQDYFLLTTEQFQKLVASGTQIIWGTILAIPKGMSIKPNSESLPYVEGNSRIWEPGGIQLEEADIEIDCFDSSYTIVKFRMQELSDKFVQHFPEAIPLSKFK